MGSVTVKIPFTSNQALKVAWKSRAPQGRQSLHREAESHWLSKITGGVIRPVNRPVTQEGINQGEVYYPGRESSAWDAG